MKKRTILLILITLLLGVLITGCTNRSDGPLDRFADGINKILTKVFGAINESPNVWMRVFLFVSIFAVLYGIITKIPGIKDKLDNKTIGILTFIMALATASLVTDPWLEYTFSSFAGIILGIIFVIPIILNAAFMRWTLKKERDSTFYWGLVVLAWVGNFVLWSKIPVVRNLIVGVVEKEFVWVNFIADANIIIISIGMGVSVYLLFATGLFDWGRKTVYERGQAKKRGKKAITAKDLPIASTEISKIKNNIITALGQVSNTTAAKWRNPTEKAIEALHTNMTKLLIPRNEAIKEYNLAYELRKGRAKKPDYEALGAGLTKVDDAIHKAETELGKALATSDEPAGVHGRVTALNAANSTLTILRTELNKLDAAIHNMEGLL